LANILTVYGTDISGSTNLSYSQLPMYYYQAKAIVNAI